MAAAPTQKSKTHFGVTMKAKYKIVIADDHTLFRQGLRALLALHPEFEIVGEAEDGRAAIKCAADHHPDLVLMDLSMPKMNGPEAIQEIKKSFPKVKILVVTVHRTEEYVIASLRAGANGYILKYASHEELILAITSILKGENYLSPKISGTVIDGYLRGEGIKQEKTSWESLTLREREILKLIAEGHRNKAIADHLYISLVTVRTHRANIMKKLNAHNVSDLTALAMQKGLISE
jgi:two-component system, NarL family, response regulator NreC